MNWSYLLAQEFYDQTLKEEKLGLEVTMMLKYKDKLTFYNG
jgi:cAMP-specific phosphodiesterase 4